MAKLKNQVTTRASKRLEAKRAVTNDTTSKKVVEKKRVTKKTTAKKASATKSAVRKTSAKKTRAMKLPKNYKGWIDVKVDRMAGVVLPSQMCQLPAASQRQPIDKTKNYFAQIPEHIYDQIMKYTAQDRVTFVLFSLTCKNARQTWKALLPNPRDRRVGLHEFTLDQEGNAFSLRLFLHDWIGPGMHYHWAVNKFLTKERMEEIWENYQELEGYALERGLLRKERRQERKDRWRAKIRERKRVRLFGGRDVPDWYEFDSGRESDSDSENDSDSEPVIMPPPDPDEDTEDTEESEAESDDVWDDRVDRGAGVYGYPSDEEDEDDDDVDEGAVVYSFPDDLDDEDDDENGSG